MRRWMLVISVVMLVVCNIFMYVTEDESKSFTKMVSVADIKAYSYVEVTNTIEDNIVYDNLTMEELALKLDRTLENELAGKGYLYASYSIEKGVDPYLAVAISMEETGCKWNCSRLVRQCNNVGGMKGSGCGSYGYFNTLDDGIRAFIDNIERNYVRYGLTTASAMNSKYAENPMWSTNVDKYIEQIRNS